MPWQVCTEGEKKWIVYMLSTYIRNYDYDDDDDDDVNIKFSLGIFLSLFLCIYLSSPLYHTERVRLFACMYFVRYML